MRIIFLVTLYSIFSCTGCVRCLEDEEWNAGPLYEGYTKEVGSGYTASAERRRSVLDGYVRIRIGYSMDAVRSIMGPPDEAFRDVVLRPQEDWRQYDKIGIYKGYTYRYRLKDSGTPGAFENQGISCQFSLEGNLISTCVMGLEGMQSLSFADNTQEK